MGINSSPFDKFYPGGELVKTSREVYGYYNGAYICVNNPVPGIYKNCQVKVAVSKLSDLAISEVKEALAAESGLKRYYLSCDMKEHSVTVMLKQCLTPIETVRHLQEATDLVIGVLETRGVSSGCEICGTPGEVSFEQLREDAVRTALCPACLAGMKRKKN